WNYSPLNAKLLFLNRTQALTDALLTEATLSYRYPAHKRSWGRIRPIGRATIVSNVVQKVVKIVLPNSGISDPGLIWGGPGSDTCCHWPAASLFCARAHSRLTASSRVLPSVSSGIGCDVLARHFFSPSFSTKTAAFTNATPRPE